MSRLQGRGGYHFTASMGDCFGHRNSVRLGAEFNKVGLCLRNGRCRIIILDLKM